MGHIYYVHNTYTGGPRNVPIQDTQYRAAVYIFHVIPPPFPQYHTPKGNQGEMPSKKVKEWRGFILLQCAKEMNKEGF